MRVFLNAVSIREGGSLVVLVKLVRHLIGQQPHLKICLAASDEICEAIRLPRVVPYPVAVGQSPRSIMQWYALDLPRAAKRAAADLVFSVTNYLPFRKLAMPSLLLEQHAGHFSKIFDELMRDPDMPLRERIAWGPRRRWVHRSVETATVLTVQTAALADAIAAQTRVSRADIRVIPHGPGWVDRRAESALPVERGPGPFRIGYVTKAGVQKDFATLFRAARSLSEQGRDLRLVLTLGEADPVAAASLAQAKALGVAHLIENHGEVSAEQITAIYDSVDLFVFPSLCESFGMPMVEAMARGLCIVVADTPENREIVGTAGTIFPQRDAETLAAMIAHLQDDVAERQSRARLSLTRGRDFSWRTAAEHTYAAMQAAVNAF